MLEMSVIQGLLIPPFFRMISPVERYVVMCGSSEENFVDMASESSKLFYLNC